MFTVKINFSFTSILILLLYFNCFIGEECRIKENNLRNLFILYCMNNHVKLRLLSYHKVLIYLIIKKIINESSVFLTFPSRILFIYFA